MPCLFRPSMHTIMVHVMLQQPKAAMEHSTPRSQGMAAMLTCSREMAVWMAATVQSASGVSPTRIGRPHCAGQANAPYHAHFACPGVRLCSKTFIGTQSQM